MTSEFPRLRSQNVLARLGLSVLLLILASGLVVSGAHMNDHYQNRDGQPGLTLDDLRGAYHGVNKPSSLLNVLERGHQNQQADEGLSAANRQVLLGWLQGDRLSEDYDNLDLGDLAPAEILAANCLDCHDRGAKDAAPAAQAVPLSDWIDVKKVAFEQNVEPTSMAIVIASLHTHSISLGLMALVVSLLLLCTRWSKVLVGGLILLASLGLMIDFAAWLLTRQSDAFVYGIVAGGALFAGATGLALLLVLVDLWRPLSAGAGGVPN